MYISALGRIEKKAGPPGGRKSLLVKGKVVETFQAEIATADQIQQTLHISQFELRRLNRCRAAGWYFKHRLKASLFLESFIQAMKKKIALSYLKSLEQGILETERENRFQWRKA